MKEHIMADYERLSRDDSFSFDCHPGISCFNNCCGDVNIVLTPYDIIRLKRRLGISSTEFLARYTIKPFTAEQKFPLVLLKMDPDKENKPCPLVTDKGCSVYEDRPWPCRMYPVGVASARTGDDPDGPEFYFLMSEDQCEGFKEEKGWTIGEWMENQGVAPYDEMGGPFRELTLHPFFRKGNNLNPHQMEMFHLVCYDIDRFRDFVFKSKFLECYDVDEEVQASVKEDDVALLRFGYEWLKTCLFAENVVKLRAETVEKYKARLAAQGKRVQPE